MVTLLLNNKTITPRSKQWTHKYHGIDYVIISKHTFSECNTNWSWKCSDLPSMSLTAYLICQNTQHEYSERYKMPC